MDTEDGQVFIKNLAYFIRTHEKALANALQLQRQGPRTVAGASAAGTSSQTSTSSATSTFAAALSLPYLNFTSQNMKPAKLTLTPHHLFYLLSRFEELGIAVGPMNIRLENIHADTSGTNYVSFLSQAQRRKSRKADSDSIHSVSSIRSVMSGMSSLWSNIGLSGNSAAKMEKQKQAIQDDLKYLFSAFTKIPCLKLAPDNKARLIAGYEEFPFDSAVPLFAFKNLSALEICDVDFRQFYGWDRLAEQLRSLTVKRGGVDDPIDLLINIVLDDMDKRRKRSSKNPPSPVLPWPTASPRTRQMEIARSNSTPTSPVVADKTEPGSSPQALPMARSGSAGSRTKYPPRQRSSSPIRPSSSRHGSSYVYGRHSAPNVRRSSGSSGSSVRSATPRESSVSLLPSGLPSTKWRFLRHLSLAENGLTTFSAACLAPLADSLQSLDISGNLFTEIPDTLANLTALRALNLSNCMIESLHSLGRNPLPAITTLNLRANRLASLAGIERLFSLERVDLRDNKLTDPTELARLTGIPEMQEIYVHRNPFVKTHSNYRVTIFNLFRSTPGYTEDIIIDSAGPGYSERKQLVDRAPEAPTVPVIRPLPKDDIFTQAPSLQATPPDHENRHVPKEPVKHDSPQRTQSDYPVGSQRRRKATKRRIVELSQADAVHHSASESKLDTLPKIETRVRGGDVERSNGNDSEPAPLPPQPRFAPQPPPLKTSLTTSSLQSAPPEVPPKDIPDFDLSGDMYKKKIEALRQDFGNNWLTALGGETWDSRPPTDSAYSPSLKPPTTRAPSQGIVSGGRTLG